MKPKNFVIKICLITVVVVTALSITDQLDIFQPDDRLAPAIRVWDGFYEFAEDHEVDILIVGNSKVHYGIRPKVLSVNLKANVYSIGAGGTRLGETYFSLVEAFKVSLPKLVVVETFAATNFDYHRLNAGQLSNQFKSFGARRDVQSKFLSTPELFTPNNYFYAWSATLRNHHNIFGVDSSLYKNNIPDQIEAPYLGEAFQQMRPLTKETLQMYKTNGAAYNMANQVPSKSAIDYLRKIDKLCRENGVELMFLTIPMYPDHLLGYDVRRDSLNKVLNLFNRPWLNLQEPFDSLLFSPDCFEDVYDGPQHLTYKGATVCSYKLSEFISDNIEMNWPDRSQMENWRDLFYGKEGYFKVFPPKVED